MVRLATARSSHSSNLFRQTLEPRKSALSLNPFCLVEMHTDGKPSVVPARDVAAVACKGRRSLSDAPRSACRGAKRRTRGALAFVATCNRGNQPVSLCNDRRVVLMCRKKACAKACGGILIATNLTASKPVVTFVGSGFSLPL